MTRKEKGHYRNGATQKALSSTCNYTGLASRIKAAIVTIALRGFLPFCFATWLFHRLHLGGA